MLFCCCCWRLGPVRQSDGSSSIVIPDPYVNAQFSACSSTERLCSVEIGGLFAQGWNMRSTNHHRQPARSFVPLVPELTHSVFFLQSFGHHECQQEKIHSSVKRQTTKFLKRISFSQFSSQRRKTCKAALMLQVVEMLDVGDNMCN